MLVRKLRGSTVTSLEDWPDGTQVVVITSASAPFRLGQRVWIHVTHGRIEIARTPQLRRGAGRYSRRVRRGRPRRLKTLCQARRP